MHIICACAEVTELHENGESVKIDLHTAICVYALLVTESLMSKKAAQKWGLKWKRRTLGKHTVTNN